MFKVRGSARKYFYRVQSAVGTNYLLYSLETNAAESLLH